MRRSIQRARLSVLLALALAGSTAPAVASGGGGGRPDIYVFVIDDVAASDVEVVPTPTLDMLARGGVAFSRAYSHAWCKPTRDSLFRSVWKGRNHGVTCRGRPVPATLDHGDPTLASLLQNAGYETAGFGKWHLGVSRVAPWPSSPHLFGYENYRAGVPDDTTRCAMGAGDYWNWHRIDDGTDRGLESVYQTIALRDEVLAWIDEDRGEAPRFAMVNFQACHAPFHVPPAEILPADYRVPPNPTAREMYEAMIVSVDFVLGQIVRALPPEAWILVLADNGTPEQVVRPGQSPNKAKHSTFRDGVRVPLILSAPGLSPGFVVDQPVHVVDLLPTLADLIGLHLTDRVAGQSLFPALRGEPLERDWVFVWTGPQRRAVATRRWKLRDRDGARFLYDLEHDPWEESPVDPTLPEVQEPLRRLTRILQDVSGP